MIDLYGQTLPQLREAISTWGMSPQHAVRLWRYLYREAIADVTQMIELPVRLRNRLQQETVSTVCRPVREAHSADELTRKYLLAFGDGRQVETVLMRYGNRATACLSSQVGCPLGCVFCATGLMGFERNLTTAEIIVQALHVVRELQKSTPSVAPQSGRLLSNVVLMGMGEPLLNYDAVMNAVEIMHEPGGLAVGTKQTTLSTVGVVPGIIRLADERRPIALAVSLHAADQDERAVLVPSARTWPLSELMDACRYYTDRMKRKIFFEWTLIAGQNDSVEQARQIVCLLRDLPAQVNLIPLNPVEGLAAEPSDVEKLQRFRSVLSDHGVPVSIRRRRGIDIDAGCGQLAVLS